MAEESDLSQKTEEPTLRRLDEARKKGQTASSREINHWFMIGAGSLWIAVFGPQVARDLGVVLLKFVESPHAIPTDSEHLRIILLHLMRDVAGVLALPIAIMTAAALAAGVLQGGFVIAVDRIMPNLERISLFSGAQRLFSMRAILEFVKGIVKLGIVAAVVTMLMMPQMRGLASFTGLDMVQVAATIYDLSKSVFLDVLVVVSVIAALDFLYQRYEFRKSLRMSRQEMREEYKQTEGDPTIKSRLRQLRMERARRRMMAAVPEADVVITNPNSLRRGAEIRADGNERAEAGGQGRRPDRQENSRSRLGKRGGNRGKPALGPGALFGRRDRRGNSERTLQGGGRNHRLCLPLEKEDHPGLGPEFGGARPKR